MKLSDRLQRISQFVTGGNILADIGTDHGYIPIYLVENGTIPYAYACDVKDGPLERARDHIMEHSLEDKIETVKSDGLEKLHKNQADTILIAGMGGALTVEILKAGSEVLDTAKELIVSPHSELNIVRKYLDGIGYEVVDEDMIIDAGKYYVVMKWVKKDREVFPYTECELFYGRILLKNNNHILYGYLNLEKLNFERIYEKLLKSDNEEAVKRRRDIGERLKIINEALGYYI